MSVALKPETIRLIEERMRRGGYASSGEPLDGEQVLADLRDLRNRNQSKAG